MKPYPYTLVQVDRFLKHSSEVSEDIHTQLFVTGEDVTVHVLYETEAEEKEGEQ